MEISRLTEASVLRNRRISHGDPTLRLLERLENNRLDTHVGG
jgi:hypothetical protein